MNLQIPLLKGSLPLVGHLPQFIRNADELLTKGYKEHGEVFKFKILNNEAVVLLGPEYHKFFFKETDKTLSMREAYPFLAQMFAPDFFFMGNQEQYKKHQSVVLPRFSREQMHSYIDTMFVETANFIKDLGVEGEFEMTEKFGVLVMNIAAHCFLGKDFKEKIGDDIFEVYREFSKGLNAGIPEWLPTLGKYQSQKAKKVLHKRLMTLIDERRKNPLEEPDFFQTLIESKYKDGTQVEDLVIVNLILMMVWAGHETTAGHICWGLIDLLQNSSYLKEVEKEQKELLDNKLHFDINVSNKLKKIDNALKESERLHPVANMLMRYVTEDIEVNGYKIDKKTLLFVSPSVAHRMSEVFENPREYKPERFETKQKPHTLIGFGGGVHRCTGVNFAYLEMKVVLTMLLQYYNFELIDKKPVSVQGAKTKWPKAPCRVKYKKKENAVDIDKSILEMLMKTGDISKCPFHQAQQSA